MWYRKYGKRIVDLVLALLVMVCFWWLLVLIVIGYLVFFQYPILFKQTRIGKDNKPFAMLKFRTLALAEDQSLNERSFFLGKLLRLTSLDELPQLWNIFLGEMSFIGPRPLPEEYLPLYSDEQRRRHEVNPGITGWAQVNGRNAISWEKKFELDGYYVENVSFLFDLSIMIKTLLLLISFKKDVSLEEKKFTGN